MHPDFSASPHLLLHSILASHVQVVLPVGIAKLLIANNDQRLPPSAVFLVNLVQLLRGMRASEIRTFSISVWQDAVDTREYQHISGANLL